MTISTMPILTVGLAHEMAQPLREQGLDGCAIWKGVQQEAMKHTPIFLGIISSVTYDSKTDRYVVRFGSSTAKATNEVAEALLRELNNPARDAKPTVYAKMRDGAITNVFCLYQ